MSKHRLLLADDSVTIQKVVNLTFADEGIEVITAGDGNTAMEKFVESTPDLVMVDVNMPGFDGYRICEMIKQDEETKHIPVILLVGSFEPFDETEARRVGADDYLTKPFHSIRQLVSRVSDLLNRANGENSSYKPAVAFSQNSENTETSISGFDSFSETKKIPDFGGFDDAEMDDEMIQTNQIGSLPADETQKFVFEPSLQTSKNSFADSRAEEKSEPSPKENPKENVEEKEEDLLKMDSFQVEGFGQMPIDSADDDIFRFDEKIYEFAGEPSSVPKIEPPAPEQKTNLLPNNDENLLNDTSFELNEASFDVTAPSQDDLLFDFDDLNLLDIPPIAKKPLPAEQSASPAAELSENLGRENVVEKPDSTVKADERDERKDSPEPAQLSPEVIEAIAKKIMEKLSEKVIKEIAREMTPQMAESIIKEMAQKNG